jgi:hypothetical protein
MVARDYFGIRKNCVTGGCIGTRRHYFPGDGHLALYSQSVLAFDRRGRKLSCFSRDVVDRFFSSLTVCYFAVRLP